MTDPAPARRYLLWQYVVIAVGVGLVTVLLVLDARDPVVSNSGHTVPGCFAAVVAAVVQATWISLDRIRLGKEVGWWRFLAIFFGPPVIWVHLILQYRLRALYLIPISILLYGTLVLVPLAHGLLWGDSGSRLEAP